MQRTKTVGFDNERYLEAQSAAILERMAQCGDKLYLELGGKLFFDHHAARVLPGYDPNNKIRLLERLHDRVDIVLCISARDVDAGRTRGGRGMARDLAALRTLDDLRERGLDVTAVRINRFHGQLAAVNLKDRVESRGVRVYTCGDIAGYPSAAEHVCSAAGFGSNPPIRTSRSLVVIAGTGPRSGKTATALQQLWHDQQAGHSSSFARWGTFPIRDLPLQHPVNVAYEAATADLAECNLADPFHLQAYGETCTSTKREVDSFPALQAIVQRSLATGSDTPQIRSPTDMGINCASEGIADQELVQEAARQEIIRRFLRYQWESAIGVERPETVQLAQRLMSRVGVELDDRRTLPPARRAAEEAETDAGKGYKGAYCGAAIELPNGEVVTGKNSALLYSTAAAVINAIKRLGGIPDRIHLLSPVAIRNLVRYKTDVLGESGQSLDIGEALSALSVSAAHNPAAEECFRMMPALKRCEMHMTHVPTESDQQVLRQLGVVYTTDAHFTPGGYFLR